MSEQVRLKSERCRTLLPMVPAGAWLPPVPGGIMEFRNRAKLAVGGTRGDVTLGILDAQGEGVDLRECLIHEEPIYRVIPDLAAFLNTTGLEPYSVPARRGELKYVHVTASPAGELMLRFVVRSEHALEVLRSATADIRARVPSASVISVNLLPEHRAVLEGEREELLHGSSLKMRLASETRDVTLHLRPQSFFQTNTSIATALYSQASRWVDHVSPASVWDLYCGVGGFALCAAGQAVDASVPSRRVLGVEMSEQAIRSAERSARESGISATFLVGDATEFALASAATDLPDLVIVNPPRRGIGEALSDWIESSPISHVIYSSCNPESLARDLQRMPSLRVSEARLFDMFPHTSHLEVALLLERI